MEKIAYMFLYISTIRKNFFNELIATFHKGLKYVWLFFLVLLLSGCIGNDDNTTPPDTNVSIEELEPEIPPSNSSSSQNSVIEDELLEGETVEGDAIESDVVENEVVEDEQLIQALLVDNFEISNLIESGLLEEFGDLDVFEKANENNEKNKLNTVLQNKATQTVEACEAIWPNGLQTHSNSFIAFIRNATLINAPTPDLETGNVLLLSFNPTISCDGVRCDETGTPVPKLQVGSFQTTNARNNVTVPRNNTVLLGDDGLQEYRRIRVRRNASLTFAEQENPYIIKRLTLSREAELNLPAGDYWIERLDVARDARINIIGEGTARIYVERSLQVSRDAVLGNTNNPEQLFVYTDQSMELKRDSQFFGFIYAKNNFVTSNNAQVTGGVTAKRIVLSNNTTITYSGSARDLTDFSGLCIGPVVDEDITPPELTIDDLNPTTELQVVTVTGVVSDSESGVAWLNISVNGGQAIIVDLNGGQFSVDLSLALGANTIDVTAADQLNNIVTEQRQIERISLPVFSEVTPLSSTIFTVPVVSIQGQVLTDWPASEVVLRINGNEETLQTTSAGVLAFGPISVSLHSGVNVIDLDATTPSGSEEITRQYIYQQPPPPDTTPPNLTVSTGNNMQVGGSTVVIQGTVSDPIQSGSGMAGVVVYSQEINQTFNAVINGATFQAEVPLNAGYNHFTITASDLSGNTTQATRTFLRFLPPAFIGVTPVSGTALNEPEITISGNIQLTTFVPELRLYVNGGQTIPDQTATEGLYQFSIPNFPLSIGVNTITLLAVSPQGNAEQQLTFNYTNEDAENFPAPVVTLLEPLSGSFINEETFQLRARVVSEGGAVSATVNGTSVPVTGAGGAVGSSQSYAVNTLLTFPNGVSEYTIAIDATDALGKTGSLSATFTHDAQAPQITVYELDPAPQQNPIVASPFTITGQIIDDNLSSLTINNQPISLTPGSTTGQYNFTFPLMLSPGEELSLTFTAQDVSGGSTSKTYLVNSTATEGINPLLPSENTQLFTQGEAITLQVVARITTALENATVLAGIDGALTPLDLTGTLASGNIVLPAAAAEHNILYQLLDENQTLVASASRHISVVAPAVETLALISHDPINNARLIEVNQPIELFFNQAIDPSLLSIEVKESLTGQTYINSDEPGADFISAKGHQLQSVYRSNELLPGALTTIPGNKNFIFYPSRYYGFSATLLVDVKYQDTSMGRFTFSVRPLPTFLTGGVSDQFGQPLVGVPVRLVEARRETVTNADGGFAFGFNETPGQELSGGRYQLLINEGFAIPSYGTQVRQINLQEKRQNNVGMLRLHQLHPGSPFQNISSFQPAPASLAGGELLLDLSQTQLIFNGSRAAGIVQAQFLSVDQLYTAIAPGAQPWWAFAIQPRGIQVENTIGITLKLPALRGRYDYLPANGYVVLVGYNAENDAIEPVGLGQVTNRQVTSIGKVNLTSLDYIGFAAVHVLKQDLLVAFKETALSGLTDQQYKGALRQLQIQLQQ